VLAAVHDMNMEIEANPDKFHRSTYMPRFVDVRRKLAQLIGANLDECVLVPNASAGVNTILRNFEWKKGDIIVICKRFPIPLAPNEEMPTDGVKATPHMDLWTKL
jgi:selenocysteine lyase/cysteine desulfurase